MGVFFLGLGAAGALEIWEYLGTYPEQCCLIQIDHPRSGRL